jgi:hypothetical protein
MVSMPGVTVSVVTVSVVIVTVPVSSTTAGASVVVVVSVVVVSSFFWHPTRRAVETTAARPRVKNFFISLISFLTSDFAEAPPEEKPAKGNNEAG